MLSLIKNRLPYLSRLSRLYHFYKSLQLICTSLIIFSVLLILVFKNSPAHADIIGKTAENIYDLLGKSNSSKGKVVDPNNSASSTNANPPSNKDSNTNLNADLSTADINIEALKAKNINDANSANPLSKELDLFKSFDQSLNIPQLKLSAQAWVLYDVNAEQILNTFEGKKSIPLGEFNQLMLLYLVFDALNEQQLKLMNRYNISALEQRIKQLPFDAPKMLLDAKTPIELQTLIKGMIYSKGFDAAQALAYLLNPDYLENPENLLEKMNEKAQKLGLKDTTFENFIPLLKYQNNSENNSQNNSDKEKQGTTTVNDLLILTKRLHADFPKFTYLFEGDDIIYNQNHLSNQNTLNVLENATQNNKVIHGFYKQTHNKTALILRVKKTENNLIKQERFLIGVIVHAPDSELLEEDSLKMMNYGLAEFDTVQVYKANDVISAQKLWMGKQDTLKIGVAKDAYIALPKNMTSRLNTVLDKPKFLYAPVEKGQVVAKIRYFHQNKEVGNIPVVSLENVEEAFFLTRLWHMVLAWFE